MELHNECIRKQMHLKILNTRKLLVPWVALVHTCLDCICACMCSCHSNSLSKHMLSVNSIMQHHAVFFIMHFLRCYQKAQSLFSWNHWRCEDHLSVSESGLLSSSVTSSTADVIWVIKSEHDIPRRIAVKFVLYVRKCHVKYPVQIPVPSDLAIIVGDSLSEELERRYESCKDEKCI